jgi:hypothetical protein
MAHGFACAPPYALTPGQPPPGRATLLRLASGSPTTGPAHETASPEGSAITIAFTGLGLDGRARVREYQPVIHRLRLSASP